MDIPLLADLPCLYNRDISIIYLKIIWLILTFSFNIIPTHFPLLWISNNSILLNIFPAIVSWFLYRCVLFTLCYIDRIIFHWNTTECVCMCFHMKYNIFWINIYFIFVGNLDFACTAGTVFSFDEPHTVRYNQVHLKQWRKQISIQFWNSMVLFNYMRQDQLCMTSMWK